jgi:hypothetical protein
MDWLTISGKSPVYLTWRYSRLCTHSVAALHVVLAAPPDLVQALRDGMNTGNAFQAEQVAKEAAATEAGIQGPTPLAIKVATGDGGPDKIYHFPRDTLYDPRHMVMFEHIEGEAGGAW